MLYSSKSTSLQVASFCHRTAVAAPSFTFWCITIERNKRGYFYHHLLRVKTFPGVSPFLNASLWVSWAWMVSQCLPKRWPVGWYCYHSWTIKVHLEAQVALQDGLSLHSAWRLTVHTGLLDAHLPLLELLHHPQAASFHKDTLLTWLELWHCTHRPFHEASPEMREALNPQYRPTSCTNEFVTKFGFWHPCSPSPHWDWLLTQWQSVPTRVKTLLRCNFYSSLFKEASWYDK